MDLIAILGAAIIALGAITPIIVKYYNRADKYLTVIQMFLDGYREFLVVRADGTVTDEEYIALGKKYERLVLAVEDAVDVPVNIFPKGE